MSELKLGFARLDITPPMGVQMAGYFYERRAVGVLDPLYVNAIALQSDKPAVLLTCDLIMLRGDAGRTWPGLIAEELGLAPEQIFLHCIHTHTGPICGSDPKGDPQYDAWLFRRLCDAGRMAIRNLKPVTGIRGYEGICPGVTFSRRFKMKDGTYQTWCSKKDPNVVAYADEPDESLRFVVITREGAEDLLLVNFASHPDSVCGEKYSADYPGFLRRKVEANLPGTKCVFFNGTEGELITGDMWRASVPEEKYVRTAWSGNKLADFVLAHYDEAAELPVGGVSCGRTVVTCPTKRDPGFLPEARRILAIRDAGREEEELGPDWIATPLIAEALVQIQMDEAKLDEINIPVSAVSVGGLAFLGIAGEPFGSVGKGIRAQSPNAMTFTCCITNGWEGYYPTDEAYDQGGYEPAYTKLAKGVGNRLIDAGAGLLKSL